MNTSNTTNTAWNDIRRLNAALAEFYTDAVTVPHGLEVVMSAMVDCLEQVVHSVTTVDYGAAISALREAVSGKEDVSRCALILNEDTEISRYIVSPMCDAVDKLWRIVTKVNTGREFTSVWLVWLQGAGQAIYRIAENIYNAETMLAGGTSDPSDLNGHLYEKLDAEGPVAALVGLETVVSAMRGAASRLGIGFVVRDDYAALHDDY